MPHCLPKGFHVKRKATLTWTNGSQAGADTIFIERLRRSLKYGCESGLPLTAARYAYLLESGYVLGLAPCRIRVRSQPEKGR